MSRRKKTAFAVFALIIGLSAGMTLSYMSHEDERQARSYCMNVEQGLQEQMDEGFANCMLPGKLDANLSETVEENSNLRCVCRRKTGETVEVIQITTAN